MTTDAALQDRHAVITGASSGIGAATARTVVARGGRVALLARRADRLEALATEIGDATTHVADVADLDTLQALPLDGVDLVVANAGVMLPGPAVTQPYAEWRLQVETNVMGVLATTRAFLPALQEAAGAGRRADLVLISSIAASQVFPEYAVYCATKAAVTQLGASLRAELGPQGVRVSVIEPGFTATELQPNVTDEGHRAQLEEWFGGLEALQAQDVADLVAHVAALPARVNLPHIKVVPTGQP